MLKEDSKGLIRVNIKSKNQKGIKHKFTGCKTLRDAYQYYREDMQSKGLPIVNYKIYAKLIKDCNKNIVNYIVESGDHFKLPCGLGNLTIRKKVRTYSEKYKNNWPVDYKKTKELGFIVYFTTDYKYKWVWKRRSANFVYKGIHVFIPSRDIKRAISYNINIKKKDYYF